MREVPVLRGSGIDAADGVGVFRLSKQFEQELLDALEKGLEVKLSAHIKSDGGSRKAIAYNISALPAKNKNEG